MRSVHLERMGAIFRAQFFCGDVIVKETELYRFEAEYFEREGLKEFNDSYEKEKLEALYGCAVSVRIIPVPVDPAPVEEKIAPTPKWRDRIFGAMRRASSFFGL